MIPDLKLLSQLDTESFTLEEVMAVFRWRWKFWAKLILGTGVRRGEFVLKDGRYSFVK